jgi:hypothetical protein
MEAPVSLWKLSLPDTPQKLEMISPEEGLGIYPGHLRHSYLITNKCS